MNEAGRDLMDWCEANDLVYLNRYVPVAPHPNRGTWQKPARGTWHEIDGFLMKNTDRQKMVQGMKTLDVRPI